MRLRRGVRAAHGFRARADNRPHRPGIDGGCAQNIIIERDGLARSRRWRCGATASRRSNPVGRLPGRSRRAPSRIFSLLLVSAIGPLAATKLRHRAAVVAEAVAASIAAACGAISSSASARLEGKRIGIREPSACCIKRGRASQPRSVAHSGSTPLALTSCDHFFSSLS